MKKKEKIKKNKKKRTTTTTTTTYWTERENLIEGSLTQRQATAIGHIRTSYIEARSSIAHRQSMKFRHKPREHSRN